MVIARYEPKTGWRAVYLSYPLPAAENAYDAWTLLSIVDMDEDGVPEVVLHGAQDTEYWDVVVSHTYLSWDVVARSAGGSTI